MESIKNPLESKMSEKCFSLYLMSKDDLHEVFSELMKELSDKAENLKEEKGTLLTTEQTMKMLGCSRPTLWRWKKEGYLVPIKVGGKPLYQLEDINKVLKRGEKKMDKE